MRCQNCGIEIDTRQENADGTIICPGCGTVYRKKAAIKNEPKELQGFGHPVHDQNNNNNHGSFWKWQIVAASLLVIAIIAVGFFGVNRLLSDARKRRDLLTEPSPTPVQMPATSPTPTPTPRPTATPAPTPTPTPAPTPTPTPFPTYNPGYSTYTTPPPYNSGYPSVYATPTPYSYPAYTPYYYPTPTPTPAPTAVPITDVYLQALLNAGTQIQAYNWQNNGLDSSDGTTRQVAFCDVTGDGSPEILYLYSVSNGSPRAAIKIGTYSNGSIREIYNFDQLDAKTGTHSYCFFTLKGDNSLYAYLNDPDPYNNAKFFKLSSHSNGTFDGSYLMGMSQSASGQVQYTTAYGSCTEAEFNTVLNQIRQGMDKVVFSGHMRTDGVFAIPAGISNISVTYEQAVSSLISGSNITAYYTFTDGINTGISANTPVPQVTITPQVPVITPPVVTPAPQITIAPTVPTVPPAVVTVTPTATPAPAAIGWVSSFKDELSGHRDAILQYSWQNGYAFMGESPAPSRPVAFTDFTGDGQFDMLYISAPGTTGTLGDSAQLKIVTFANGSLQEVYSSSDFDPISQAYPEYCVFQINGDTSLYLYESDLTGGAGNFYFYKLTPQGGKLTKNLQLSAVTSDGDSFLCKNASGEISLMEFYTALQQLTDNISQVLLSGHMRGNVFSIPGSVSSSALTYDEAIAALNSVK